jgi:hypothetical protein
MWIYIGTACAIGCQIADRQAVGGLQQPPCTCPDSAYLIYSSADVSFSTMQSIAQVMFFDRILNGAYRGSGSPINFPCRNEAIFTADRGSIRFDKEVLDKAMVTAAVCRPDTRRKYMLQLKHDNGHRPTAEDCDLLVT